MKPVRRNPTAALRLPVQTAWREGTRSLTSPTTWHSARGDVLHAACLNCPDRPCSQYSPDELALPTRIPMPACPDPAVCPTGALQIDLGRPPEVSEAQCVGCGLCAVRCPVGAIHVQPHKLSAAIAVNPQEPGAWHDVPYESAPFGVARGAIQVSLQVAWSPDPGFTLGQYSRLETYLHESPDPHRVLRLLVRNTLLAQGWPARLSNVGDNNAPVECAADVRSDALLVEIEHGPQPLDGVRRVLAGVAMAISRHGLQSNILVPAVVLTRVPNVRTDYYRLVSDVVHRLGIRIRTLPASVLLLQIASGTPSLGDSLLGSGMTAQDEQNTLRDDLEALYDMGDAAVYLGAAPRK